MSRPTIESLLADMRQREKDSRAGASASLFTTASAAGLAVENFGNRTADIVVAAAAFAVSAVYGFRNRSESRTAAVLERVLAENELRRPEQAIEQATSEGTLAPPDPAD
ncbi:MAG TPA: hypothetical protein VGF75_00075 [Candidatus Saccharimonadales bacterium]